MQFLGLTQTTGKSRKNMFVVRLFLLTEIANNQFGTTGNVPSFAGSFITRSTGRRMTTYPTVSNKVCVKLRDFKNSFHLQSPKLFTDLATSDRFRVHHWNRNIVNFGNVQDYFLFENLYMGSG